MQAVKDNEKQIVRLIWGASILVPIVVGILLNPRLNVEVDLGFDPMLLPKINAFINSMVSILLVLGFFFIRSNQVNWHKRSMLSAFVLSAVFLITYVLYHLSVGHRVYCDDGLVSPSIYYFTLITHIGLSVFIIPLASFSVFRALSERIDRHRKLAKITLPLWLYVSVTGVLVYFFIAPCG